MNKTAPGNKTPRTRRLESASTTTANETKTTPVRKPEPPAWRQAFNRAETIVGRPLESMTNSPETAAIAVVADRLKRRAFRQIDALASWGIHQLHLPSHRDLRMLQRQLSAVQRQLSDVQTQLHQVRGGSSSSGDNHGS
jgi:hypothetical protein